MPGVGPKSAQRLAFHILGLSREEAESLTRAVLEAKQNIKYCSTCFNITDRDPCEICSDTGRDHSTICVVEEPKDLMAVERTHHYRGTYHVLGGALSPLQGRGVESLRIKELLRRLGGGVMELVLAMNPTTEGEATVLYLTKLLTPFKIKITRIAYGLPIGGDLDYADEATLTKALEGRREINV